MSNIEGKKYHSIKCITFHELKSDRFKITVGSNSPLKDWFTRSTLLDSYPGYLELHEFLYPQRHQKPLNYFEPAETPENPILIEGSLNSSKRTFKELNKDAQEDVYLEKRYPIISRFNLDSKANYIYLNDSTTPDEDNIDIVDGCSLYSSVPGIEPFSLGESNLIQAALDEGLLGQALQLTSFFVSSFKVYPEPEKAFDLLVKCMEIVSKYIASGNKAKSLSGEKVEMAKTNINATRNYKQSYSKPFGPAANDLNPEELGKLLNAMARLLENLRAYLKPLYFYEMLNPLFKPFAVGDDLPKKYPVKIDLWQWIEWLGWLQSEISAAPSIQAISSGQLLGVIVVILQDDVKQKGLVNLVSSMLFQLLPGTGILPCTKLERVLDGLRFCEFKHSSGQAWISAIFHLQHLIVLLSHANIASADSTLYLTHGHYLQKDSLYSKRIFLQGIISLPFKCQLIDLALRASLAPLYNGSVGGWIEWARLRNVHLKVSFDQILALLLKRFAPSVKVQLEVRVTRTCHQLDSATACLVHEELEHHIRMLHMLLFSYFFYRSKTHHPADKPYFKTVSRPSNIMDELRTSLHELGQSLPAVESFLATSLKAKPTLVPQFSTLLETFPFPFIPEDQIIDD